MIKKSQEKQNVKEFLVDSLFTIVGTFIFASAIYFFTAPNQIAPGGMSGISTVVNYITKMPIGTIYILINIPLVIVGLIYLGKWFMVKTFISIVSFTFFSNYVLVKLPVYSDDMIVAALFGGVCMGIGMGLVLSRGGSTGGMDIINKIIAKKVPHLKLGQITFCTDIVIILISGAVFKSVPTMLYAIITIYVSMMALDKVLYGFNVCKLIYIVSIKADEISNEIISQMKRGATILESYGAYTNEKIPTIMCAVRQNEYFKLKQIIKIIDPNAFIMLTSATEIVGSGFKSNDV